FGGPIHIPIMIFLPGRLWARREPPRPWFVATCSNPLSYRPHPDQCGELSFLLSFSNSLSLYALPLSFIFVNLHTRLTGRVEGAKQGGSIPLAMPTERVNRLISGLDPAPHSLQGSVSKGLTISQV
ncbi:hypothetical protein Csa_023814, partial [Cucumis sativus]